jgi:myo-inositol 2-dehydrogenase/D-chiro-inositol 1-dehydrogenase
VTRELTVGLVGAGLIASVHARAYRHVPGVRLVAVLDPVAQKARHLAEDHGADVVADLDALLALGVDVVDVCTPPRHHAAATIAALRAQHHVMCEKPLTRTLDDARRVVEVADQAVGVLMVGHVSRFEPDHRAARELAAAGEIGSVRRIAHSTTSAPPQWSEGGWHADPAASGGPLLDQAVHSFDYARWVIGSPAVRVHCMAADSPAGPDTYALATVRYANGAIAQIECSWAHPESSGFRLAVEMVGTEGKIDWSYDHLMGGVLHRRDDPTQWWDVLGDRGFIAELNAFFEAVRSGGPSPVPAREAMEALRTALAAAESASSGRTVDLTTWQAS